MNEIIKKSLLAEDKLMHEMHLRQPRFTYNARGPFSKTKKQIQKFKETEDLRYIYQNKLNKVCSQNDMPSGNFKDLLRTASDKVLHDKDFNIAKNRKNDGYQWMSMVS